MKRCPVCEKTFDDSMRFCQADGTPLEEDAAPLDPFKTMMARPGDFSAATSPKAPDVAPSDSSQKDDEQVLELPSESDPLKTMFASEADARKELAGGRRDEQVFDLPPLSEPSTPKPPPFGDKSPPSPFSPQGSQADEPASDSGYGKTTPPIPSPFSDPKPSTYKPAEPDFQPYTGPASSGLSANPFDDPKPPVPAPWTPAPPPEPSWQNPNKPFQVPTDSGRQNQTMAIVSLVLGIVSIVFCQITGPVAIVTGFMARRKAAENPSEYGGAGLGLAGIITGVIGTILLLLVILYLIFVFGLVASQTF